MEEKILKLFTKSQFLKFNEIEKKLEIRSNKLAYHLKNLVSIGKLTNQDGTYALADLHEEIIPYISDKKAVLPIILVHIGNSHKAYLIKRDKRPFREMLGLPGGRMLIKENFKQATERIMLEKYNLKIHYNKISSVHLEHVRKNDAIIHSFLLIVVKAASKEAKLSDINKNRKNIIYSDYKIIKSRSSNVKINEINTKQ